MLTVRCATYGLVQCLGAKTAGYGDGAEAVAQGLQHHVAEEGKVQHHLHVHVVIVYAKSFGGVRASKLAQTKVFG